MMRRPAFGFVLWAAVGALANALILTHAEPWKIGDEIHFEKGKLFQTGGDTFDLSTPAGLQRFLGWSEVALKENASASNPASAQTRHGGAEDANPLIERRNESPTKKVRDARAVVAKRDARGLALMHELARQSLAPAPSGEAIPNSAHVALLEVANALANNHRPAMPRYIDFLALPVLLAKALRHPVGIGDAESGKIRHSTNSTIEIASKDSFWREPPSISQADLRAGFSRASLPTCDDIVWQYAGPKKAGRNGGCELLAGQRRLKAKFAEIHSEPFTARIFHALGFYVTPTDYCPGLRIAYDRRFFTEFNSRPPLILRAGIAMAPLYRIDLQNAFDPFDFVESAQLKDGRIISRAEMKSRILKDPTTRRERLSSTDFNNPGEQSIAYFLTVAANVQDEPREWESIGPWGFEGLGYEDLREARGAGLLAAWLGWWDARFENTRLRARRSGEQIELRHYFSDLGGGLGACGGTFHHTCERLEDFGWTFTRVRAIGASGKGSAGPGKPRFEICGFEPVEENAAFRKMTIEDARWMAKMIAQLTPQQIEAALSASGFSDELARGYTARLLSRREQMLRDLGMDPATQMADHDFDP